jgi:hypothetical protein
MRQTVDMHAIRLAAFAVLVLVVGACQAPAGQATSTPNATPVAPAVEPTHPDAERTIELPSASPIAPAIEPEPTGPEPTIELPDDVDLPASVRPIAPAIEPEPTGPEPTIELSSD